MNTKPQENQPVPAQPILLTARDVGALLALSRATVFELHARGRLPLPVRPGGPQGAPRWRADEIRAWVAAGCPDRERWEAQRGGAQ